MKLNSKVALIVFIIILAFLNLPTHAQTAVYPSSGDGSESSPFEIATLENLYWLTQNSIHWDKYFIQTNDINAAETRNWDVLKGLRPIGNTDTVFGGTYDGDGHIIDSLFINRPVARVALFGNIWGAHIKKLGLTHADISGGVASGGLAGYSRSTVYEQCFITGKVKGDNYTGGLVGGFYQNSLMINCYADVELTTTGNEGGGLLGRNWGSVKKSYSISSVLGTTTEKGIFQGSGQTGSLIENCYWQPDTSSVSGSGVGNQDGLDSLTVEQFTDPCAFPGTEWDFADDTTNGTEDIWGMNSMQNNGYPFLTWQPYTNHPALCAFTPDSGQGTMENPYEISSINHLLWLSESPNEWDKYYIQTRDIQAKATKDWDEGQGFSPIGSEINPFGGTYDGLGHIIDSLYINRSMMRCGFFGNLNDAEISNLGITNADVSGGTATGIMAGYSSSVIYNNCFVTGKVSGSNFTGGFVGGFYHGSVIENAYADVDVTGNGSEAGGFVGRNGSTIKQAYSLGSVTGPGDTFGAFQGNRREGSTVEGCFWNKTLSSNSNGNGIGDTSGLFAITNEQMRQYCTFLAHQWDFMNDTINGNANHWGLNSEVNQGYPFLAWQGYEHTFNYTLPTIECAQKMIADLEPDSASYTVQGTALDPVLSEAYCEIVDITNDFNNSTSLDGASFTQGSHFITWTLTDTSGNHAECISEIEINRTVGIHNIFIEAKIYPNPAKNKLFITDLTRNTQVKIYDYAGKIVFNGVSVSSDMKIDLSPYPRGIYLIQLKKKDSFYQEKIVIE